MDIGIGSSVKLECRSCAVSDMAPVNERSSSSLQRASYTRAAAAVRHSVVERRHCGAMVARTANKKKVLARMVGAERGSSEASARSLSNARRNNAAPKQRHSQRL